MIKFCQWNRVVDTTEPKFLSVIEQAEQNCVIINDTEVKVIDFHCLHWRQAFI